MGRETLEAGTEVDASKWRNTAKLEEQRYLKPLENKSQDAPKRRGRKPKQD
jgi:hypothetical protein